MEAANLVFALPDDIVRLIFDAYCTIRVSGKGRTLAPVTLSHVCRLWRSIAIWMPNLWVTIRLEWSQKRLRQCISRCNVWMKRSGSLPLSVYFAISSFTVGEVALACFLLHSHRTKLLSLIVRSSACAILPKFVVAMPALQELVLYPTEEIPTLSLGDMPKLQKLTVMKLNPTQIGIPYHQLRSLRCEWKNASAEDTLKLLQQCTNIASFNVSLGPVIDHTANIVPFTCQSLSRLEIGSLGINVSRFVRSLTAPNLRTLRCDETFVPTFGISGARDIARFLQRSNGPLTSLALHCVMMDDVDLISVLRASPNLEHLVLGQPKLKDGQAPSQFIALQTPNFGEDLGKFFLEEKALPKLQNMMVAVPCGLAMSDKTLVRMTENRMMEDVPGRSLLLNFLLDYGGSEDVKVQLQTLLAPLRASLPQGSTLEINRYLFPRSPIYCFSLSFCCSFGGM